MGGKTAQQNAPGPAEVWGALSGGELERIDVIREAIPEILGELDSL